jgi:hypothetical protein
MSGRRQHAFRLHVDQPLGEVLSEGRLLLCLCIELLRILLHLSGFPLARARPPQHRSVLSFHSGEHARLPSPSK